MWRIYSLTLLMAKPEGFITLYYSRQNPKNLFHTSTEEKFCSIYPLTHYSGKVWIIYYLVLLREKSEEFIILYYSGKNLNNLLSCTIQGKIWIIYYLVLLREKSEEFIILYYSGKNLKNLFPKTAQGKSE